MWEAMRIGKLEHARHVDLERLAALESGARTNGWRLYPDPPTAPHTLPRHYTGGDPALIDVPAIEPPNRYESHVNQTQGPPT